MQYIAAVTGKSQSVQKVKDQIIETNPVLGKFLIPSFRLFARGFR
jgi:myosin heavy subunit